MEAADERRPQAVNVRTKRPYQPGIGPHTEAQTVAMVLAEMERNRPQVYAGRVALEVPYPNQSRSRCDVCFGAGDPWEWAIEIKMLRFKGDNGKPNDNILMHILSPYPAHRSAVTDCQKLLASGLSGRKALLVYGYDYDDWPMDPAIEAFELLASRQVALSTRAEVSVTGLVHPVHRRGRVFGWELRS
jgi:hypothetical protein